MSNLLQQIKNLVPSLPQRDTEFATKFIQMHDWESLKELTQSALDRIEIANKRGLQKYEGIDVDAVRELAILCSEYYYIIYPEDRELLDGYDSEEEEA